jgi:hypothetical protein
MKRIPLTKNEFAIVDEDLYEHLSKHKWYANTPRKGNKYAERTELRNGKKNRILMHRYILGESVNGKMVDHINGNGLDNRRSNLRVCTHSQNQKNQRRYATNRSGFKGVHFSRERKKWRAMIDVDCKKIHLGYFEDIYHAANAYDIAARTHHKEFANLNFPEK